MATATATLNDIALGDATPGQARALLGSIMGDASAEIVEDVYLALRAWVWKALNQRRRDAELREWQDIISAVSSMVRDVKRDLSAKLAALQELLWESVTIGERLAAVDVTKRQHVREILAFLDVKRGSAGRNEIGRKLGLQQSNLSRVLTLMSSAGLLERLSLGKEATFRLTRAGLEAAASNRSSARSTRVVHPVAVDKPTVDSRQVRAAVAKLMRAVLTPESPLRRPANVGSFEAGRQTHVPVIAVQDVFAPGARIEETPSTSDRSGYSSDRVIAGRKQVFKPDAPAMADG